MIDSAFQENWIGNGSKLENFKARNFFGEFYVFFFDLRDELTIFFTR